MNCRIKLLQGLKFNFLTAIKRIEDQNRDKRKSYYWLWRCDCGREKKFARTDVTRKTHPIQTCGECNLVPRGKGSPRRLATGELNFNRLFCVYKISARNRDLEFSLNRDDFRKLTKANCVYCGIAPSSVKDEKPHGQSFGPYIYNGIDRVDSSKGYTNENCVPACTKCNYMKTTMSRSDFIAQCKKIITYQESIQCTGR